MSPFKNSVQVLIISDRDLVAQHYIFLQDLSPDDDYNAQSYYAYHALCSDAYSWTIYVMFLVMFYWKFTTLNDIQVITRHVAVSHLLLNILDITATLTCNYG